MVSNNGIIEDVMQATGKTGVIYWKVTIDGETYTTFDKTLASLKYKRIHFNFEQKGKYLNLKDYELDTVQEEMVGSEVKTTITKVSGPTASPSVTERVDKAYQQSNYYEEKEKAKQEFEDRKQILIVRQSCQDRATQIVLKSIKDTEPVLNTTMVIGIIQDELEKLIWKDLKEKTEETKQ